MGGLLRTRTRSLSTPITPRANGAAAGNPAAAALPDIVYPVRPGDSNEELRHSLRSVEANVRNFRRVWILGTVPSWLRNVGAIELTPHPDKFENQRQSLTAMANHPDVASRVVLFNDDFFVREPVDLLNMPVFHLGLMADYIGERRKHLSAWRAAISKTADWAEEQGYPNPLAYETHTPLMFDRAKLRQVLADYPAGRPFAAGEVYPIAGSGRVGVRVAQPKVSRTDVGAFTDKELAGLPYLSSSDNSFRLGKIGDYVRRMFPDPCRFEDPLSIRDEVVYVDKVRLRSPNGTVVAVSEEFAKRLRWERVVQPDTTNVNVDRMTKAELAKYARSSGIDLSNTETKADMLRVVNAHATATVS